MEQGSLSEVQYPKSRGHGVEVEVQEMMGLVAVWF
jgi:hypothetical protein